MNSWQLIWRSLTHHARSHLGVVLGAAVGSAALIGALLVGDSIRGSLRHMALARLGGVTVALESGDRFFRDQLADELTFGAAPLAQVSGTATRSDGEARANNVQVIGMDERLAEVAGKHPKFSTNAGDAAILNTALASHLGVKPGDSVLLRVQKPSLLSREAPITPQQDSAVALRLTVAAVAGDEEFGRFSLRASQVPPHNAFVPLRLLQQRLELGERANVLLVSGANQLAAEQQLKAKWQLADAELELSALTNTAGFQLSSRRVFIDPRVVEPVFEQNEV